MYSTFLSNLLLIYKTLTFVIKYYYFYLKNKYNKTNYVN